MFCTPTESPKNLDLVCMLPKAYIPFSGHSAYIADTEITSVCDKAQGPENKTYSVDDATLVQLKTVLTGNLPTELVHSSVSPTLKEETMEVQLFCIPMASL